MWSIVYTRFRASAEGHWIYSRPMVTDEREFDKKAPHFALFNKSDSLARLPLKDIESWHFVGDELESREEAEAKLARLPIEWHCLANRSSDYAFVWADGRMTFSARIRPFFNRETGVWHAEGARV